MTIEKWLKELKKDELVRLARQLNATGYSGLSKESLIDHIIDNSNEQDITAALNRDSQNTGEKIPWWKRHKIASLLAIISLIGSIATIIALLLTIKQGQESKKSETNQNKWRETLSKKLDQYDPLARDRLVKELKEKNEFLETALKDERAGNTKERKEALNALKKGNPTKAQELFKKRIEKDKNNLAVNYLNLGNAFYMELKIEEALESYNKSIEIKPDYQDAWYNKGVALADLGRHEEAIKALDKAIEIKPDYHLIHEALANKGYAIAALGRHKEALKAYDKAKKIQSKLNK